MILFTISHSVFGKENPVEILVNSREMALELSYVYIKYVYGKEKAEFLQSLELFYKVFFLGDIPDEELQKKADAVEE